jgi:hypothetical protein
MYNTAITASPFSYSKVCDTSRPRIGQCAAVRTDLGGKIFVNFLKPRAMLNSLVRELCSKRRSVHEAQSILFPVIAVVPHKVDRAGLLVKQSGQRFDTIAEYQLRSCSTLIDEAGSIFNQGISTASQSVPFTPRPEGRGFSGQI